MGSYAAILRDAAKARWDLSEATTGVDDLDFSLPFLPQDLVHADRLPFLSDRQKLLLNQIRAHAYLQIFVLSEKFIVPFVMTEAGNRLHRDADEFLALMQFGQEEAKHIALFERFATAFENGFGADCDVMGPAADITARILAHDTLAVALMTLHFEWMTQEHYVRAARDYDGIDPHFSTLLRLHWREEAQHARLDALMIAEHAGRCSSHQLQRAVDQYLEIVHYLSQGFEYQVALDLKALESITGELDAASRATYQTEQRASYNEVFLRQGMDHRRFRQILRQHFDQCDARLDEASEQYRMR